MRMGFPWSSSVCFMHVQVCVCVCVFIYMCMLAQWDSHWALQWFLGIFVSVVEIQSFCINLFLPSVCF